MGTVEVQTITVAVHNRNQPPPEILETEAAGALLQADNASGATEQLHFQQSNVVREILEFVLNLIFLVFAKKTDFQKI